MYKSLLILCISFAFDTMPTKVYKLDFNTSYNQFYIEDAESKGNTGGDGFWSETAYADKLAISDGVLGVGTGSYGHIRAQVCLLDKANPDLSFARYDHIVEGSLRVGSGYLQIVDCPNSAVKLKLKLKSGNYRVRVYSINLAQADHDLYDGKDSYKIEIWPDVPKQRVVLKRYK